MAVAQHHLGRGPARRRAVFAGLRDVRAIAGDAAHTLWFGTDNNGLFHLRGGRLVRYGVEDGLPDNRVRVIRTDRAGRLWIGTYGGISLFFGDRFTTYTTANGLPCNLVRALHAERDGVLWIGTYGIGIAPADMDRLFRRFSRLEGGRERGIEGTGLGLFICRSIVEAHGCRIWVESVQGRGSTFHFSLRRAHLR